VRLDRAADPAIESFSTAARREVRRELTDRE